MSESEKLDEQNEELKRLVVRFWDDVLATGDTPYHMLESAELRRKVERQAKELRLTNEALKRKNSEIKAYKQQASRFARLSASLREELDEEISENRWRHEFLDRMAKHCGTKDCPSLVAYVGKLEADNAELRELVQNLSTRLNYLTVFGDVADLESIRKEIEGGARE